MVNDDEGFERKGYGVLDMEEGYRVVLGLDSEAGEGVALALHDSGKRGVSVHYGGRTLRLGRLAGDSLPGCQGLEVAEGEEVLHSVSTPDCG